MTLDDDAIAEWISTHPGWSRKEGALTKLFEFPAFRDSIVFVNRVATIADEADHHPDIDIRYDKVRIGLVSHDAGGITEKDTAMAHRIDFATSKR